MIQPVWRQLRVTLEMIKIEHTVFALPFAFIGAILARARHPRPAHLRLDPAGDDLGPQRRHGLQPAGGRAHRRRQPPDPQPAPCPGGLVSRGYVAGFVLVCSGMFLLSAWMLNRLSFILAFPALALVLAYSFSKRFTSFSHILLGLALSIAPVGGWIAVTGRLDPEVLLLCLVVVTWVAGFDIVYSCQDVGFDSKFGLFSIPARWGVPRALVISFGLHMRHHRSASSWCISHTSFPGSPWPGIAVLSGVLVYEHVVIRPGDLTRVNMAFFTLNGIFSISLFILILGDVLVFPTS